MSKGLVVLKYLFTTLPFLSTRNFSKFHFASFPKKLFGPFSLRYLKKGCVFGPFTSTCQSSFFKREERREEKNNCDRVVRHLNGKENQSTRKEEREKKKKKKLHHYLFSDREFNTVSPRELLYLFV